MTDNEIITALGCCWRNANHIKCTSDCPMYEYCESDKEDDMNICGLALDLINRQKAEIERLKSFENTSHYWYKKCNELVGEIETEKAKAIKGFAERLKEKIANLNRTMFYDINDFCREPIDNLVKEMTEEKENA